MRKIVWKGLRGKKKETRLMVVMLSLVFACNLMFIILQESLIKTKEESRYRVYGEWTGAVYGADDSVKRILDAEENIISLGQMEILGNLNIGSDKNVQIGTADKEAVNLSRIEMAEGRLPQNDREAAVEKSALSFMPEGTKVGDMISLSWHSNETDVNNNYMLTGVIEPLGSKWDTAGYTLPSIFLGWGRLKESSVLSYYFFKQYHSGKVSLSQPDILASMKSAGSYIANENAYPSERSAADYFFKDGKIMLLVYLITTILVGYILSIAMKKRKYSLIILRGMGASVGQVIRIMLWEGLIIWGMALAVGILIGAAGTAAVLSAGNAVLHMGIMFSINIVYVTESIIFTTVIFFMGNVSLALQTVQTTIGSSFKEDSGVLEKKKIPALKKAEKLTVRCIFKRSRIFHIGGTSLRMVLSFIVIVVSAATVQAFLKAEEEYTFWKEQTGYEYLFAANNLQDGLTEKEIAEIKKIPGIISADTEKYMNDSAEKLKIHWEGFYKSDYVKNHRKYSQVQNGTQPYDGTGDYFELLEIRGISPKNEEKLLYYQKAVTEGTFDKEEFNRGEECILFLPPYQIRDQGYDTIDYNPVYVNENTAEQGEPIYRYEDDENSIQPGDKVKVSSPWGEREITVGGIIKELPPSEEQVIAVGDRFLDKLCARENENLYNSVQFHSDENADLEETDRMMEEYFAKSRPDAMLSNTRLAYEGITQQKLAEIFQSMTILTIMWLLYFLIMYQGNTGHLANEKRRIGIFRAMGMSQTGLKKMYLCEYTLESLLILAASIMTACMIFLLRLRQDTSFDSISSLIYQLSKNEESLKQSALSLTVAILIFFSIYIITIYIPIKKILKTTVTTTINDLSS